MSTPITIPESTLKVLKGCLPGPRGVVVERLKGLGFSKADANQLVTSALLWGPVTCSSGELKMKTEVKS